MRTPSRLTNSPSAATTFEWLSGQAAGQNFSYPDGATGILQNVQNALGGTLLDVQVAAGHTHVCVTARAALACYNKAGELVSLGHGLSPRVETAKTFFTQAGISVLPAFDGSQNQIKDGRIIFDQHTDRFYMFFQERGQTARLLIAASRSEDPSDGWYAWADDETQYNAPNGTLNGQDYDYIGLNANYLLASSDMEPCALDSTNTWTCNKYKRTLVHFIYNLSELSAGAPAEQKAGHHRALGVLVDSTNRTLSGFWPRSSGSFGAASHRPIRGRAGRLRRGCRAAG